MTRYGAPKGSEHGHLDLSAPAQAQPPKNEASVTPDLEEITAPATAESSYAAELLVKDIFGDL